MSKSGRGGVDWPAASVENRKVADLVPYAGNSKLHPEEQIEQICASIREWGWTVPVLVDEDHTIIAGHGRILAAQKLGIVEVPCMVARGWSGAQRKAYVIADNKLTENGEWDDDQLRAELAALAQMDFAVDLVGFSTEELAELLNPPTVGKTDPDAAPALQAEASSVAGDVWILGNHRLRCGDSTSAEDVEALLQGVKPHLMVTDPPYGVEYDPSWRIKSLQGGVANGTATGVVQNDDRDDWRKAWDLFPGDVAYVWHGALHAPVVAESLEASRFGVRSQIVWVKTRAPISRGHYHWQHEPALYAERGPEEDEGSWSIDQGLAAYVVKVGKTASWRGGRKQTTVWFIEHLKSDTGHGTQKPVECMRRPILNNSSPGQAVYEPFCGSGTTLIAGEMEGRAVYAMELDPRYVDVIVKRWQEFTGRKAILEETGAEFAKVAKQRKAA